MSRLLHYNPENDLALASNALSYTPTAAAQEIRRSALYCHCGGASLATR